MPPGPRPPVIPSPYDRPTHGGNSNGNRWPLRDMPPGPRPPVIPSPRTTRSDLTREILEETRASHRPQSQKGQLDPGRAGRRNVRRGSGPQDLGGRRNGQRGSTTEEAGDEEGEGRGDDGRDGDQDPNDLAEKYERQTQKIMISPHEPLSVNVRDSEPPPEAADSPSPADFPGGAPQARRRAGVRANEWTAPGRGGGRAGRAGRDRGDAYRGYD